MKNHQYYKPIYNLLQDKIEPRTIGSVAAIGSELVGTKTVVKSRTADGLPRGISILRKVTRMLKVCWYRNHVDLTDVIFMEMIRSDREQNKTVPQHQPQHH